MSTIVVRMSQLPSIRIMAKNVVLGVQKMNPTKVIKLEQRTFSTLTQVHVTSSKSIVTDSAKTVPNKSACGTSPSDENTDKMEEGELDDDDDYMEEMFVEPYHAFEHSQKEWGGPTRGGRLAEPTRFGDWERKGRCTDF